MITLEDLPRKDGFAVGTYHLVHKLEEFCAEGFGYRFEAGRTVEPITGRPMMRLLMSMGVDLTIEPADMETARGIWDHIHDRGYPESRIAEIGHYFSSLFTTENEKAEAERAAHAKAKDKDKEKKTK